MFIFKKNITTEPKTPEVSAQSTSFQFKKGSTSSLLYSPQTFDLEEELYQEDSLIKLYKDIEKEESSKG